MIWSDAQAQAISTRGSNLVVSAGAGSGKTAVLIERVLQLLETNDQLHVENILIMTFTEAAAGEMRGRLVNRMEQRIQEALQAGDIMTARRFEREADRLWSAQISTIHSFCLELIRNHVFALQLSPDFRLLDGNEEEIRLSQQAKETIETALSGTKSDVILDMMIQLRLADVTQLTRLMRRMYALARSQQSPRKWLSDAALAYPDDERSLSQTTFFPAFRLYLSSRLELSETTLSAAKRLADPIEELQSYSTWLEGAQAIVAQARHCVTEDDLNRVNRVNVDELADILRRLSALANPRSSYKGVEADEVKNFRKQSKAELDAISVIVNRGEQELVEDLRVLARPIRALCELVEQFMDDVEALKQTDNVLDFGDLEHFAYRLLSSDKSVQIRIQEAFVHVFVDEYQDTSPIQDAIVDHVTHNRQNLFAVGDVKQSIYRFRMAEPGLFLRRYADYLRGDGGQAIDLTENYRSRPEIVDFVNFVFGQLFSEETTDFAYDEHARMDSRANYPEGVADTPYVSAHLLDRSSKLETTDVSDSTDFEDASQQNNSDDLDTTALEREARMTAELLSEMLYTKPMDVWDKREARMRPITPRDVAVLLRSGRGALNTVVESLQAASIPANANMSTGFSDALEVKWLISVLSVIDNPRDDLSLVTTLRSPLFHWNEEMLGRVRAVSAGSYWDALRQSVSQLSDASDVRAFLNRYEHWRDASKWLSVRELLDVVIKDTGFLTYVEGMTRGDLRRANVEKFLGMARSYDDAGAEWGIYGFLARWQEQDEANVDVGVASVEASDAVQVMTIHRSKGLEFPVVFVIDLGKQFRVTQDLVYLHRDLGLGAVRYDRKTQQRWRTVASIATSQTERKSTLAEEARILYVALTRARERLILIGSTRNLEQLVTRAAQSHDLAVGRLMTGAFMRAKSYMEWLLPVLLRHPNASSLHELIARELWDGHVLSSGDKASAAQGLSVHLHNLDSVTMENDMNSARGPAFEVDWNEWLNESASSEPSDSVNRTDGKIRIVEPKADGVDWLFGKVSATDMRRMDTALNKANQTTKQRHRASASSLLDNPAFARASSATPREQGIAFHAFMQRCMFPLHPTAEGIRAEVERLVRQRQLSEQEAAAIDVQVITQFLQSDLGRRVQAAEHMYREQPFFHRIDVATSSTETFPVVAQGVIDCLFEEDGQWTVIDYKTDSVMAQDAKMKAREYEAQVATYLAALEPLTQQKPVRAYLYFVHARMAIEVPTIHLPDIFHKLMDRRAQSSGSE